MDGWFKIKGIFVTKAWKKQVKTGKYPSKSLLFEQSLSPPKGRKTIPNLFGLSFQYVPRPSVAAPPQQQQQQQQNGRPTNSAVVVSAGNGASNMRTRNKGRQTMNVPTDVGPIIQQMPPPKQQQQLMPPPPQPPPPQDDEPSQNGSDPGSKGGASK